MRGQETKERLQEENMRFKNRQSGIFSLNEGWKFINEQLSVLPEGRGHNQIYGFSKAGGARGPAAAAFDDSGWETVSIPHDWVTAMGFSESASPNHGYKGRGCGWYRLKFLLEEKDLDKQILLEFEGVTAEAKIYVNGSLMKYQRYTYNSFVIDITDIANFGTIPNVIAVYVDAGGWEGWWYEGAGIYRNVWLYKKEAVHVAHNGIFVKPVKRDERCWDTEIGIEIENTFLQEQEIEVSIQLFSPEKACIAEQSLRTQAAGMAVREIKVNLPVECPQLWDIEKAALYEAKVTVRQSGGREDFAAVPYGYRSIRMDADTGFWLNGRNVKLKGTCNHHDHAGIGAAVPYAVKEYRIGKLLELGANAYRCAHNPDPEIIEICDRVGMLVMNENRTFSTDEQTITEVRQIVRESRNHPSVILYSVFNEEPWQGGRKGKRLAARLQHTIRMLDDTRPVLGAFNGGIMEENGAAGALEVVGINYNPGGYEEFHKAYPHIPVVASETASAFMVRGEYETSAERHVFGSFDTECAAWGSTARDAWNYVLQSPFVAGAFVWTGFDYRGEPTPYVWPSVSTFFGIYDSCGFEKEACYLYQALWTDKPMVHLAVHWNQNAAEGTPVEAMVFSNCEEIALYLNERLLWRKPADHIRQYTGTIPYEKGILRAEGYCGGSVAALDSKRILGNEKHLRAEPHKNTLNADGLDAAVVDIRLVDENGTLWQDDSAPLTFAVENGIILGVGNGDPNSHEADIADHRSLFHGCAQVIVRNTGTETVKITVSCPEAETVSVEIAAAEGDYIPHIQPIREEALEGWKMYHRLFEEKPEADMEFDISDMNSMEPVSFEGMPQPKFSGQPLRYGLYRVEFNITGPEAEREIYFPYVLGKVWCYLNGELVYGNEDRTAGDISVILSPKLKGRQVLTVILQNTAGEDAECGILRTVLLRS